MEFINGGTNSVVSLQTTLHEKLLDDFQKDPYLNRALKALLEFDYLRANSISLNIYRPLRADCKD